DAAEQQHGQQGGLGPLRPQIVDEEIPVLREWKAHASVPPKVWPHSRCLLVVLPRAISPPCRSFEGRSARRAEGPGKGQQKNRGPGIWPTAQRALTARRSASPAHGHSTPSDVSATEPNDQQARLLVSVH